MKAIRIHQYGEAAVMQMEEVDTPTPNVGEVVIKQEAIGVNYKDTGERSDGAEERLPFTPGVEGAGIVNEVGDGVEGVRQGERVAYVVNNGGGYSQQVTVPADKLIRLPDDIPTKLAAAVAVNGMTAHYLLHEYRSVQNGVDVLIHGAAGGMGLILVQWAKKLGARVIGTCSTEEKERLAREAGADDIIRYTEIDFAKETRRLTGDKGVELVIDGVGKSTLPGSLKAVASRGHVVVYGNASGVPDPIEPLSLIWGSYTLAGGNLFDFIERSEELSMRAESVFTGIREGWLDLKAETVLPLSEAVQAHEMLENRSSKGKIVLDPTA
ncbi:quinone oxidoreductase family protein [Acaryochloris marina NIES-2412]|uniref:quinone oxidoreductase family protein n=1 Tax=Acaryochloris marina TaxID=155978 RepID=UPI0040589D03